MNIITLSSLYPNSEQTRHGIFVEQRLRHLLASTSVQSKVVAPIPWFPISHRSFGRYAVYAKVLEFEKRHGIEVYHPRYPVIPKIGMSLAPLLMANSVLSFLKRKGLDRTSVDLIDAHYFYPDCVAAVIVAKKLNKPVVITARGSDLNIISDYYFPRRMILWAADRAAAVITVSHSLRNKLIDLGADESKIRVLRNGVDLTLFVPPENRDSLRTSFEMSGTVLLSVGNLITLKGHDLVIRALKELPDCCLLIIGEGPQKQSLMNLAKNEQVAERVTFLGTKPQEEMANYYGAADMLVLASTSEGWANVLLESMACGTPVIATDVGGNSEVVAGREAGMILENRTVSSVVNTVERLKRSSQSRESTRKYAEQFSWDETSKGQIEIFSRTIKKQ